MTDHYVIENDLGEAIAIIETTYTRGLSDRELNLLERHRYQARWVGSPEPADHFFEQLAEDLELFGE